MTAHPDDPDAHYCAGRIQLVRQDAGTALSHLEQVVQGYYGLELTYMQQSKLPEALKAFETVLALNPEASAALAIIAAIYRGLVQPLARIAWVWNNAARRHRVSTCLVDGGSSGHYPSYEPVSCR